MDVKPGTRVRNSYGDGIILAPDDCEVINKYSHRSQKWRDGYINGWSDMSYISYITTPQEKVEAARKALAEAEAELAASIAPKAGDRYYSPLNGTTATVKMLDRYRDLNLYVYTNPVHRDLVGAIGVLHPRDAGWENARFVVDGSTVVMVNPDPAAGDIRPLSWEDRVK